jgi:AcrR family transcriptional regulator
VAERRRARASGDDRPLTAELVVDASLDLLDEVGLEGFSMRALAERLGTYPASLYWHVGDRNELLAATVSRVLAEIAAPPVASGPWQEWLRAVARSYRATLHRHPNVAALVASQLTVSVLSLGLSAAILDVLHAAGFTGDALNHAYNAYVGSVVGWVSVELSANPNEHDPDWQRQFSESLTSLAQDHYPIIAANLDALADRAFALRWHGGSERPLDAAFEAALDVWIDGLAARLPAP